MARAKRTTKPGPAPPKEIRRFDEFNIARLGLISIHERIPADFTSWTQPYELDGRVAQVKCVSPAEYGGVPHGLDGDISTAIIDLFIDAGAPASGEVRTTAYRLLQRAGFPDTGHYYQSLKQSLFRLRFAGYTVSEGWRDHARGTWTTATFNYLDGLEFESEDKQLNLSTGSELLVRLAKPIVRSIRAKFVKPLDYPFLTSLDRPLTRALYRLLDARRYTPENPTEAVTSFRVDLLVWAQECKIRDTAPDKIRRTLGGAHDELVQRGYLRDVGYAGRGRQQTITYTFETAPCGALTDTPAPDTPATARLIAYRVSRPVALQLVAEFGETWVLGRVEKFEHLLRAGYKVRVKSALLVDVVRDVAGKYLDPAGYVAPEARERAKRQAEERTQEGARTAEAQLDRQRRRLPRAEQVEATLRGTKIWLERRLSGVELSQLKQLMLRGDLDPGDIGQQVTRAAFELRLEEVIEDLKRQLRAVRQQATINQATIDMDQEG